MYIADCTEVKPASDLPADWVFSPLVLNYLQTATLSPALSTQTYIGFVL